MTFTILAADRIATVLADDPVVDAADVAPLGDALALLAAARDLHETRAAAVAAATDAGSEEGRAVGYREGRAAGEAAGAALLAEIAARDRARDARRAQEVARLALEVVRRIAGALGPADTIAALAERAADAVATTGATTVRVAPVALAAAEARLGARNGLHIVGDPALTPDDCVIETELGRAHAGLDTQLAQIARAWGLADDAR
jgi:flagellar biosynthesis/type III secretory pathway protein FliH